MYRNHTVCRACGFGKGAAPGTKSAANDRLIEVFDLGVQPLANDFCGEGDERAGYAPLKVTYCPRCTLAQLSVVVDPSVLYSHYLYVTSPSRTMQHHFEQLTTVLSGACNLDSVLEIGSNDGAYLDFLRQGTRMVCGIDPADNLAHIAREKGIPTVTGTFSRSTAESALRVSPKGFDLIVARHVFCHVDDWTAFVDNLAVASHRNTLVALEVPYVKDLLDRGEFDTIYHEHLSYLSLKAMSALLRDSAWTMHDVCSFPVHGGAIVILLRRRDWDGPTRAEPELVAQESINDTDWLRFKNRATHNISQLDLFVREEQSKGKRIAGLGASAKSTVWINACGFTRREIQYITDTTPQKQWRYSPGTDIPITDEGAILRDLPDYVVCFAWNFLTEILAKNQRYLELGGKIVVPIPELSVFEAPKTPEKKFEKVLA